MDGRMGEGFGSCAFVTAPSIMHVWATQFIMHLWATTFTMCVGPTCYIVCPWVTLSFMPAIVAIGDSSSMVGLLQRSTSAAQRMQVLECLQRDDSVTRAKLAADPACLAAIEEWVLDLIEDRMSFHVLETVLKVRSYVGITEYAA